MSQHLTTDSLRLTLLENKGQFTGYTLDVRQGAGWKQMATSTPLSHLIYLDNNEQRHEADFNAVSCDSDGETLTLRGGYTDTDAVTWSLIVSFALTDNPNQVSVDYQLETSAARKLLRWLGPCLYAGEGSFGSAKDEAIFPGLEYLLGDEPSSDTRFAAEKFANRTVPHPYKITIPLMAVSHEDYGVGLLWEPNQAWGRAWRHPAALFSSPNQLQDKAANHWLALFAPGLSQRWFEEGKTEACAPASIDPNNPYTLSARLAVSPDGGAMGIVREWVRAYGLPDLPDPGHDYHENIGLSIESYLDIAWDDASEGWHHTLADPWGPRFEPILANQVWRYSRRADGDPVWRARARDQVLRALPHAAEKQPPPHNVPWLELALTYGNVPASVDGAAQAASALIAEQQADGSWGWTPETVMAGNYKTDDRLAVMGSEQDSATGLTSSRVIPVLKYALASGDSAAVESVIKAADWCNTQQRPEGAQTWELHLHVPDVLAVPYLINLNLAAYQLTGDDRYLDAAQRWAWTGLPFTFLWNPYYRPIMRYGTLPVFGVTFHDVQSWFGVIVQWNGLWYADALFRLATYRRSDGPIDWYDLAEGITRHGMQEQMTHGPYKGMYPDVFSTVKGDEDYTWWLNPQLIGLNTFPLAGLPLNADPVVLCRDDGSRVHITSGATIEGAQVNGDGTLQLTLCDQPGETSYTLIAGQGQPQTITVDNTALSQTADLDSATQGWQWLAEHNAALVKIAYPSGAAIVRCGFQP